MKTLNLTLRTFLLTLAIVGTATTALAYDFVVKGIYYNINGNNATVTYSCNNPPQYYSSGYEGDYSGEVIIPETVSFNGITYTVTAIGGQSFYKCPRLTSISLPKSIKSIGNSAFFNCYNLKYLTFPESVTSIGEGAFLYCSALENVIIPDSVISIGKEAFEFCSKLAEVTIGSSVSSIGSYAFYSTNLKFLTCKAIIPPTVANTNSFSDYSSPKLYVPLLALEDYRTTFVWSSFTEVLGYSSNELSVRDTLSFHGDTIVIPVSMQNESSITAFQTDVYLPEDFELVKVNDEYQVSLSDRKGRDHVIMVNDAPDGALRVLSYSPTLKSFKNNEGELFYISVKVPEGASGTFPIWLRNTILTSTDEEELYAIDALSNVKVYNYKMGDVNNSGDITIADVVTTARYILNYNPEPFVFEAADMNGDSKITITDVVKIANLILDQDYEEPTTLRSEGSNSDSDRMSGEAIGNTVSINLDNEVAYTALQMDLTLPEGMTASDFALANRASSLSLIVKDKGNGKVRVIAYSPNLKNIKGNNGAVLAFNVDGTMGDIIADRIEMVNSEGKAVRLNAFTIAMDSPTSLNEMTASKTIANVKYFNLAGQQMTEPATGVTLIVTTYTDGSRSTSKVIR